MNFEMRSEFGERTPCMLHLLPQGTGCVRMSMVALRAERYRAVSLRTFANVITTRSWSSK